MTPHLTNIQPIAMIRGTTHAVVVTVYDEEQQLRPLKAGELLIFGVKSNVNNTDCCIEKILTEGTGEYVFHLAPEDTEGLACGKMCYDVGLQSGSDYYPVIPCSPFVIHHNVTKRRV